MRFRQLDSLRGLAAVSVMLHHFIWARFDTAQQTPAMPRWFWIGNKALHILFLGHEAVMLFFVLSGVVLAMAIQRRRPMRYGHYCLHRACRIYLPYLASLALAVAACAAFYGQMPHWSSWLAGQWTHSPRWDEVLAHILFLGTYSRSLNSAYWSLIVEMRISLLLPLLVWALQRLWLRAAVGAIATVAAMDALAQPWFGSHLPEQAADWLLTVHFALFFCCGILIALHRERLERLVQTASPAYKAAVLSASVLLSFYIWPALTNAVSAHVNMDFLIAPGVAAIVSIAMYDETLHRALTQAPLLWLGKVSYSLYLIHLTVMMTVIALLGTRVNYPAVFAIGVAASLLTAGLMAHFVERPAQELGRRVDAESRRLAQPVSV